MCKGYGSRSVCECVCLLPCQLLHTSFIRWKSGVIRLSVLLSMYVLCGFRRKRFVQKFWRNLLITSAFFTSWWTLNRQKRQRWLLFDKLACRTNDRSYNSTDSSPVTVDYQQSLLAFFCAKLLIRHVHGYAAYYVVACNCTCAFLWLL